MVLGKVDWGGGGIRGGKGVAERAMLNQIGVEVGISGEG